MEYLKTSCISVNSVTRFKPSGSFGIVCHDAGGTNQIVALLQHFSWVPTYVAVDGPAAAICKKEFPGARLVSDFCWMRDTDAVITGTSWASNLEKEARQTASNLGILSVSVLDHWTNYQQRFVHQGVEELPDEIWVVDTYAEDLAISLFPTKQVVRVPDCYAQRQLSQIAPISSQTPNILLYLLEPARSEWGRTEPGEFQALRFFLGHVPRLKLPAGTEIRLRPHPSEIPGKYNSFLSKSTTFPVSLSTGSLAEDLSNCRWVAGCQTYAMTIALRTGRTVFCSLPPWAPTSNLPHREIVHLRNLLKP